MRDGIRLGSRLPGIGRAGGLGAGYAACIQSLLDVIDPASRIRVINRGISGNTIADLAGRWQTDALDVRPDWLSICIGINDVWRQFDTPLRTETHILPGQYEETYRRLLQATRPVLRGLVLLAPYVIDPNREDAMRRQMDCYGRIVCKLAREFDAVFLDTQAVFDRLMESIPPTELAWDRIHPGPTGHAAIACALLEALEFSKFSPLAGGKRTA